MFNTQVAALKSKFVKTRFLVLIVCKPGVYLSKGEPGKDMTIRRLTRIPEYLLGLHLFFFSPTDVAEPININVLSN